MDVPPPLSRLLQFKRPGRGNHVLRSQNSAKSLSLALDVLVMGRLRTMEATRSVFGGIYGQTELMDLL